MYPNNDPISFICSFYGCIMAGVVPVPVEVPLSKRVGGSQVGSGYYFVQGLKRVEYLTRIGIFHFLGTKYFNTFTCMVWQKSMNVNVNFHW